MTASAVVGPNPQAGTTGQRQGTRRNLELLLLLFAMLLLGGLSISVEAALEKDISPGSLTLPIGMGVLFLVAHGIIRWRAPYADPVILPCVALLNGIGVIFIERLGYTVAGQESDYAGEGIRQLVWTIVAIVAFSLVIVFVRDHRNLARFAYTSGLVGIVLVMLPAILPGRFSSINGAKLWIIIPGVGQIQPGEFAKLALMIFIAAYLVTKRDLLSLASKRILWIDFPRARDLLPVMLAWAASVLILIFERDLGSSLMFFGMFVAMLYIATERTSWLIIGVTLFAAGAVIAWQLFSHVRLRVDIWLDPFSDPFDTSRQISQALFGLGTGGLFGTGPGAGQPDYVSFASSDFITSTLGEELGLYGLAGVLVLYLLVVTRGIRASLDVRDSFGKLLAGGLAFVLGWQVFVIVGGVSKLIPLTGLTTPFLSYGGSSLIANWCLIALLLRISDAGRRPAAVKMPVQLKNAPTEVVRL